jgi:antitoxin HigA-1
MSGARSALLKGEFDSPRKRRPGEGSAFSGEAVTPHPDGSAVSTSPSGRGGPRETKMAKDLEIVATLPPMHPGEMLREEFLKPLNLSAGRVAKACGVPRTRIERIMREELGVSGDTAMRLARFFGTTPEFWMNLQARYELKTAEAAIGDALEKIERFEAAA